MGDVEETEEAPEYMAEGPHEGEVIKKLRDIPLPHGYGCREGTLVARDKHELYDLYWCRCDVRRRHMDMVLSVIGPESQVEDAKADSMARIGDIFVCLRRAII